MDQQREMTLDEWVDRLPETHIARRELTTLRPKLATLETQLAAANEAVRVLGEYAYWNDTDDAAKHLTSGSKLDAVNKRIEDARRAVFNNPLARASVEKAGKV